MKKNEKDLKIFQAFAISPVDGRYNDLISHLSNYFSEYALVRNRLKVEIKWFNFLLGKDSPINVYADESTHKKLEKFLKNFSIYDFLKFKELESKLRHDVKPLEYLLKDLIDEKYQEFIHFGLTSEDVTNIAYALNFKEYKEKYLVKNIEKLLDTIKNLAIQSKDIVILGHTHGQSATPTTIGKELAYFVSRILKSLKIIKKIPIEAKLNGAVGNFAALKVAYPDVDWIEQSNRFIRSLNLTFNLFTKQIEPHDWICRVSNEISLLAAILIDLCKDIWLYGCLNYLKQKPKEGEIGSSTMPHKVNPIDFENCWGNMEMVIALSQLFSRKLPITFMQRDLSDSTVLRNLGLIFAHFEIGIQNLINGFSKIVFNKDFAESELENHPEVLAEAIQTIFRKNKVKNSYEILKEITRGKEIDSNTLIEILNLVSIDENDKNKILNLKVKEYIGESKSIVEFLKDERNSNL